MLNKLEYLVIARHGLFGESGKHITDPGINNEGIRQVKNLGDSLRELLIPAYQPIKILSSSAKRCKDSARVLAKKLDIGEDDIITSQFLWVAYDRADSLLSKFDADKIQNLVINNSRQFKSIVLVSHLDFIRDYPIYLTRKLYGKYSFVDRDNFHMGEAYAFNFNDKSWVHIPSNRIVFKLDDPDYLHSSHK